MKKIFSILIVVLVIVSILYLLKEGNVESNVDTMEELLETATEEDDINECIVLSKTGTDYHTMKITLNFNNADVINECLFEVKYKTEDLAKAAYDEVMLSEDNEEVMLDGVVLTYKNNVFNLVGMNKEEALERANEEATNGVLQGYSISVEKIKQ